MFLQVVNRYLSVIVRSQCLSGEGLRTILTVREWRKNHARFK